MDATFGLIVMRPELSLPAIITSRLPACIYVQAAETETSSGALQVRQREARTRTRRIPTSWPHQSWEHLLHELCAARRTSPLETTSSPLPRSYISIQLVASQVLYDLVHFHPNSRPFQTETSGPILAKRSPQLTNGHGLGAEADHSPINSMPLGGAFVRFLLRAWTIQDGRMREIATPK